MQDSSRKIRWTTLMAVMVSVAAIGDEDAAGGAVEASTNPARYDLSTLIQSPPTTANQEQRDSFASLTDALANESFSEAEIAAKHLVEQINVDAADVASARARALHNLAIAQQFNGNPESAIQNYSAALDIIVAENDNLSPLLIPSLRGLAIAYLDTGRQNVAIATIGRALHVGDVNYGPHSFNQLPILNAKMQAYLDHDDRGAALEVLDRINMLYVRAYPRNSQELLPALYQQAQLYGQLELRAEEYRAWRRILEIKQEHLAENDLALVEPHLRIAETHVRKLRRIGYRSVTASPAEIHLKKALRIVENSPDDNWQMKKDCLLAMADFYTFFDMKGRARRYYRAAWELLSSDENQLAARAEHLEKPVPLVQPKPDPYANFEYRRGSDKFDPDDYLEGEMTVKFTVNDRGRTRDLRIVAADPPKFSRMEKRVRNAIETFIYRPRYVDGVAAATTDQHYRAEYYYHPSEYEASLAQSRKTVRAGRTKNPE